VKASGFMHLEETAALSFHFHAAIIKAVRNFCAGFRFWHAIQPLPYTSSIISIGLSHASAPRVALRLVHPKYG